VVENIKLEVICTVPVREECNYPPVGGKSGQLVGVGTVSENSGAAGRKLGERDACWRLLFDTFGDGPGENNVFSVR
jgi:hypothetical protein